jgi:hypothetical protein
MTPIATKNNAIILKDSKLAENCGCCGEWYCYNEQCQCPYPVNANGATYLPLATTLFDGIHSFSANEEFSNLPYWYYDSYGMENQQALVTNTTVLNNAAWFVGSIWNRQLRSEDQDQYPYPFGFFRRKHTEPCCGSPTPNEASVSVGLSCRQSEWVISWVTDAYCSHWSDSFFGYLFHSRCYGEGRFTVGKRDNGLPVAGTYPLIDATRPCSGCASFIRDATLTIH